MSLIVRLANLRDMKHKQPPFNIHERLRKLIDIGHKHEEVKEWLECNKCQEAHILWKTEREKLRKLYPMEFQRARFGDNLIGARHKL